MRLLGIFTLVIILLSWTFAAVAVVASDVERLPGHDLTVGRAACLTCHAGSGATAPPMRHPAAPTCGFCHLQGAPPSR